MKCLILKLLLKEPLTIIVKEDILINGLGEIATRELAKEHKPYGLEQNKKIAKMGGHAAKVARDDIEKNLGKSIISNENSLNYQYIDENHKLENK